VTSVVGRVLLVLTVALLAGAAAVAFSSAQEREYEATVHFAFGRFLSPEYQILGPDFGEPSVDEEVRIQTEASGIGSFNVARATAKVAPRLGYNADQIAQRVSVKPTRGTLIIVLTARASTPQQAAQLARTYARQYLARRRKRERARAGKVARTLQSRFAALPRLARRGVQGQALRDQLTTLAVYRRLGSGTPEIIQGARASFSPARPQTTRNVLFALLFGIAVGVGVVALRSESRARAAIAAARRASGLARGEPARRS
jgi:uncharacterized protein involved in exopolysaccharide biosynthesis